MDTECCIKMDLNDQLLRKSNVGPLRANVLWGELWVLEKQKAQTNIFILF